MSEVSHPSPATDSESFLSQILKPGSSLHPTFVLIVDVTFAALSILLLLLLFATKGNLHFLGLLIIQVALWLSLKWFVRELQRSSGTISNTESKKKE